MAPARHVRSAERWTALFASRGLMLAAEAWIGPWWARLVHHPVLLVLDKPQNIADGPPRRGGATRPDAASP